MGKELWTWDWRIGAWPLMAVLAYFSVGLTTLTWVHTNQGLAMLWPTSGIYVAALLLTPRKHWLALVALFVLVSITGDVLAGLDAWVVGTFIVANAVQALVCALIFGQHRAARGFGSIRDLLRFCSAAAASAFASATVAAAATPGWGMQGIVDWTITVMLGTLIVTPLIVTVACEVKNKRSIVSAPYISECLALAGLLLAVAWYSVTRESYPMLFLPLAAAVLVTYRLGPIGASVSIGAIALVGSFAIASDLHAFHASGGSPAQVMNFYQLYLIVILAVCLPLAALLTERNEVVRGLQTNKNLLSAAERMTNIGHWYLNLRTKELIWSEGMYRIYDIPAGQKPSVEFGRGFCHPDELVKIIDKIDRCAAEGGTVTGSTRVVRKDGSVRHLESLMMREVDEFGRPLAVFGTFQDVTERVELMKQLEEEKKTAEIEASAARLLAETDQLTGIYSRRKILEVLRSEIELSDTGDRALSIAILDIDFFKAINDQFGHVIGDHVLRTVSTICREVIAGQGLVGRLGGEEFLFVFPGTGRELARQVVEAVRHAILAESWNGLDDLRVTGSFGLVTMVEGADETWLLQAADNALYEAKNGGRNCMRVAA